MARLDLGSGSPTAVLSGVTTFLSNGGKLGVLLSSFIFGTGASIYVGVGEIINAVVTFITTPFIEAGRAIGALFGGLLTSPLTILDVNAQASAEGIAAQFGWLAFPVAVVMILVVLFAVNYYREQPETGDTIVGLPFDVPDLFGVQIGTTEENEDEE